MPVTRKTPTGQPSTAEDVLEELAAHVQLPKLILEYRGVAKLKSTYTDKLPEQIDRAHRTHSYLVPAGRGGDGPAVVDRIRICRTFRSAPRRAGASARPSCAARAIRSVAADYSQIELRIMAHLSGDASLLQAFAEDRDVHQATAAEVFATPLGAGERRSAALGQGHQFRLDLWHVGVRPRAPAGHRAAAMRRRYMDLYFERYPGVKRYMDETRAPGARDWLSSKRYSAAGSICRRSSRATRRCANMRNAAPSTRRCRARRPTSSSAQ